MKKIKLFILALLVAVPFLQSCNDKIDQPSMYALVTIKTAGIGEYYGLIDNGDKIFVGDKAMVANYKPKDGQRAFMYFTPMETPVEGFKYNAKVYVIDNITTKPVVLLEDKQFDTLGTNSIQIVDASISGGYLNVQFAVFSDGFSNHIINLVDNKIDVPNEKENYISLELRHKNKSGSGDDGQLRRGFICFKLDNYDPGLIQNCKGLYIKQKPIPQEEGKEYITVDLKKSEPDDK